MTRYSQNDEQDVILKFFGDRKGAFLDIGAYDGVALSNTRALAELGWSGVMIEPNPYSVVKLINSAKEFAGRVRVIAGVVSPSPILADLFIDEYPDRGWSATAVRSLAEFSVLHKHPVNVIIPTVKPSELMRLGPFNFISCDAEHLDYEILMDLPRDLSGCELLCIEPSGLEERARMIRTLRDDFKFVVHHETPENILARRL